MSASSEIHSGSGDILDIARLKAILGNRPFMVFAFAENIFHLKERCGYADPDFAYSFFEEHSEWTEVFEKEILVLDRSFSSDKKSLVGLWMSAGNPRWLVVWEMSGAEEILANVFSQLLEHNSKETLPWHRAAVAAFKTGSGLVLLMGEPGLELSALGYDLARKVKGEKAEIGSFHPGRLSVAVQMREIFGYAAGTRLGNLKTIPLVERDEDTAVIIHEVSELALDVQDKLADYLESRKESGRIWIFLSSRNLEAMADAKEFSQKLLRLLWQNRIVVPPVRLFADELESVIKTNLLENLKKKYHRKISIHPEAMKMLVSYTWPGNWEELKATVEEAFLTCKGNEICREDLKLKEDSYDLEETDDLNLRQRTMELEKQLVLKAHALHGGNQVQMARALGISRGSLQHKLKKLGLV